LPEEETETISTISKPIKNSTSQRIGKSAITGNSRIRRINPRPEPFAPRVDDKFGDWEPIPIQIPDVESQFEISRINPAQDHACPHRNRRLSSLAVAMAGTRAANREAWNRR
jgi:hypothetical protein